MWHNMGHNKLAVRSHEDAQLNKLWRRRHHFSFFERFFSFFSFFSFLLILALSAPSSPSASLLLLLVLPSTVLLLLLSDAFSALNTSVTPLSEETSLAVVLASPFRFPEEDELVIALPKIALFSASVLLPRSLASRIRLYLNRTESAWLAKGTYMYVSEYSVTRKCE
jgi:hypothetical protein